MIVGSTGGGGGRTPVPCPVPEAATQHIRLSVSPRVSVFRSALTPSTPSASLDLHSSTSLYHLTSISLYMLIPPQLYTSNLHTIPPPPPHLNTNLSEASLLSPFSIRVLGQKVSGLQMYICNIYHICIGTIYHHHIPSSYTIST